MPDSQLTVDRLATDAQVLLVEGMRLAEPDVREPHRHDYHELIWVRSGAGRHLLDGEPVAVQPGAVLIIGRGQVHQFERAEDVDGAVVRFGEELLLGGRAQQASAGWLLAGQRERTVPVPPGDVPTLESVIRSLHAETQRPPDRCSADLQRHLVSTLLLLIERWYDDAHTERRDSDDADAGLHRRFAEVLEADFADHHDAAHYADRLGVPPAALSRALSAMTGRSTKELITDRVMLEAARLLRYTDMTVQQVAAAVGFGDPLYFSRAFKRQRGEAPIAYRDRAGGKSMQA